MPARLCLLLAIVLVGCDSPNQAPSSAPKKPLTASEGKTQRDKLLTRMKSEAGRQERLAKHLMDGDYEVFPDPEENPLNVLRQSTSFTKQDKDAFIKWEVGGTEHGYSGRLEANTKGPINRKALAQRMRAEWKGIEGCYPKEMHAAGLKYISQLETLPNAQRSDDLVERVFTAGGYRWRIKFTGGDKKGYTVSGDREPMWELELAWWVEGDSAAPTGD